MMPAMLKMTPWNSYGLYILYRGKSSPDDTIFFNLQLHSIQTMARLSNIFRVVGMFFVLTYSDCSWLYRTVRTVLRDHLRRYFSSDIFFHHPCLWCRHVRLQHDWDWHWWVISSCTSNSSASNFVSHLSSKFTNLEIHNQYLLSIATYTNAKQRVATARRRRWCNWINWSRYTISRRSSLNPWRSICIALD